MDLGGGVLVGCMETLGRWSRGSCPDKHTGVGGRHGDA